MMIIFVFKKRELKEKTRDANFSLPIKNPKPLLKKDSKIDQKFGGFGYGLPTLYIQFFCYKHKTRNLNFKKVLIFLHTLWFGANGVSRGMTF